MGGITFQPALAEAVMAGTKTVTRRPCNDRPSSPWWREQCAFKPGGDYAIQPGRGKHAIGRATVVSVRREPLGVLDNDEAHREGFADWQAFEETWERLTGRYDPNAEVWRVELRLVSSGPGGFGGDDGD